MNDKQESFNKYMFNTYKLEQHDIDNKSVWLLEFYVNELPYVIDVTDELEYQTDRFNGTFISPLIYDLTKEIINTPDIFISQTIKNYVKGE